MAVPSNTLQTYQATSNAEDVEDVAYNLSPADTPLMSMMKKEKADATYTEWTIDALAAADTTNASVEGDDATSNALTTPSRVGNRCQISQKVVQISSTQEAVKAYGMDRAFAYEKVKKMKELKIDMESIMTANQAPVTGDASTAAKLRGLPSWIATNVGLEVAGSPANGTATTARTDGTQRAFTEALFRSVVVLCATNSAVQPTVVMAGIANRANISSVLTGNTTRFKDMEDPVLNASITVYRSDFGDLKIYSNRWQRARDMFFLSPAYLAMKVLEPMQSNDLAKTGLSRRSQVHTTYTLAVKNEKAHGLLAGLLTAVL